MAKFCDEKAMECGEVEVVDGENEGGMTNLKGKELVGRVVEEGGDCCVPKKKGAL
jgi:4a-hydroxytetrahydrobiopterin dehydratase